MAVISSTNSTRSLLLYHGNHPLIISQRHPTITYSISIRLGDCALAFPYFTTIHVAVRPPSDLSDVIELARHNEGREVCKGVSYIYQKESRLVEASSLLLQLFSHPCIFPSYIINR